MGSKCDGDVLFFALKAEIQANPWIFFLRIHSRELIKDTILEFYLANFDCLVWPKAYLHF
jgi:hypothetical protein